MDFFQRQDNARRQTRRLVLYFAAAVVTTILLVYASLVLILGGGSKKYGLHLGSGWWQPMLFFWSLAGTCLVVGLGALFKIMELSRGGSVVAESLGGRLVPPHTADPDERKLRNIVEEMSIASGVPVPQIFVLDEEEGINAFAAGHTVSDAAIGVTRGAIRLLNRDELQGVIGHEFSHILNGDMRLNLRLIGWVAGIVCLSVLGRMLLETGRHRSSSRDRKGNNPLPLIGMALLVIGGVGAFFGNLIRAAVSRQREFLADAAAVQFTRNPQGLAGALKKIGGLHEGSRLEAPGAEEVGHLFFGDGKKRSWGDWFATHPPLTERVKLLDPHFTGTFPTVEMPETSRGKAVTDELSAEEGAYLGLSPAPPTRVPFTPPVTSAAPPIAAAAVAGFTGTAAAANFDFAGNVLMSLSPRLQQAGREPFGAAAAVYGLLLSQEESVRRKQLEILRSGILPALYAETVKLLPLVTALDARARLPLVEIALPALRQLSPAQYREFSRAITDLVNADTELDLFEFSLQHMLHRHLDAHFVEARRPLIQYYNLRKLGRPCAVVLSALAHAGHEPGENLALAFKAGKQVLAGATDEDLKLLPLAECNLDSITAALDKLNETAPPCKKTLLAACAQAIASDGEIVAAEAELLRAIADGLDCPLPPILVV